MFDLPLEERAEWLESNTGKGPKEYIASRIAQADDENLTVDNAPCKGCNHPLVHAACLRVCNEYDMYL